MRMRRLSYTGIIWLAVFFLVTWISSLVHGTSSVFLLGGSTSIFLSILITLIIFAISFFLACRMLKENPPSRKEHVIQLVMVFVVYAIASLFLFRMLLGFFPWDIKLILSGSLKAGIAVKIILLVIAGTIGSYIGTAFWNRRSKKK